jgi:hypothetical protein
MLAHSTCAYCAGTGLNNGETCICILREVTRAVVRRVHELENRSLIRPRALDGASFAFSRQPSGSCAAEFIADVSLVARRVLRKPADWQLFQNHCLWRAPWRECSAPLGLNRGAFYHRLYAIEARLGEAFIELKPYSLYPVESYFSARLERVQAFAVPEERYRNGVPLRPPMAPRPAKAAAIVVTMPAPIDPAPVPAINPADPVAVAGQIRQWFRAGRTIRAITADLRRFGWPAVGRANWYESGVRAILLENRKAA